MRRGRYFYRQQVWITGDRVECDTYPVFQRTGTRRAKCKPSSTIQKKLNARNSRKKLLRLIRANFAEGDIFLTPTYEIEPEDGVQATRMLNAFLRRLRRRYKAAGLELRYISTTERGARSGRIHHHLLLNAGPLDRDEVERLWGNGYCNSRRLQGGDDGLAAVAAYFHKRADRRAAGHEDGEDAVFYKSWNQSRNLIIPQPAQKDGATSETEAAKLGNMIERRSARAALEAMWPGYEMVEAVVYDNSVNHARYIHYELRKRRGGGSD